ncbi:MAG: class E sortase [Actinobacteria bacterium]|nr:class E sortase [Actinomycetota bacterium]
MTTREPAGLAYDVPVAKRRSSATGYVLDALRQRPAGHLVLNGLVVVLFLSGSGMFAYPFFTDVYTEQVVQTRLENEFEEFVALGVETFEDWEASVRGQTGAALTKIAIPDIEVETLVVQGVSPAALRAGAGHFPDSALPGQVGNVAIAGHRTTYGKPFNRIDELRVGSPIWLETPVGDFEYVVVAPPTDLDCEPYGERPGGSPDSGACLTDPRGWPMIAETDGPVVTLMACHPKGSAAERIWIRAELVASHDPGTRAARVRLAEPAGQPPA